MHTDLVVTFSGPDKTGLVDRLSTRILDHGGNWEESRLARLGGWFCGMLLVRVPTDRAGALEAALRDSSDAYTITVARSEPFESAASELTVNITCADRHGIVRDVSATLHRAGANIEELRSGVSAAPMSGEPLFQATLRVSVPDGLDRHGVIEALESLQSDLLVEVIES